MKSNLPTSPSPAAPTDEPVTTEDGIGLAHAQSWPKAGLPDFGAHLDTPCSSASHLPLIPPVGVTEAAKAPLFAVGDTVRVIHPENYPSDIRAGDTTEGTVTHILPDIRKRFVYVCSPIGSWFENQIERVTAAAPAPVSPSLPAHSCFSVIEGCTKRCADPVDHDGELYGVIQGPVFALDVYAAQGMPMEQFKATISAFAGNASEVATLKADVERLTGALKMALRHIPADAMEYSEGTHGKRVYVADFARLSLAEVGSK
jgi:hypothetical protein